MRTPDRDASMRARYRYGRYTYKTLTVAGYRDMAELVQEANAKLIQLERAVEDLDNPCQDAMAARDLADHMLDDLAREARLALAGRGVEASKQAPYTQVFPKGLEEYVEADLDEQENGYRLLVQRIDASLPPDDSVRLEIAPAIRVQLGLWKTAAEELGIAETDLTFARTKREEAIEAWEKLMVTTYGQLLGMVGKSKAERFFQKIRPKKAKKGRKPKPSPAPERPPMVPESES